MSTTTDVKDANKDVAPTKSETKETTLTSTALSDGASFSETERADFAKKFLKPLHEKFLLTLDDKLKLQTFEYHSSEHLRMSGVYWTLMAMDLMGSRDKMPKDEIIAWVMKCYHKEGGFGGNVNHDPHLLYTLSAIQILCIFGALDKVDKDQVAKYVASLQQSDGSFSGDKWGEIDTRFSYCALNCLAILGKLDKVDVKKAAAFVGKCRNFDGGFGAVPGAESHSGQIWCCVAALAIVNEMQYADPEVLGWWLSERQLNCGGLNGRPEKKEDVCYSWWVLSSLAILGRISWIDRKKLGNFIVGCQDDKSGGISDRPGNMADPFHTYFGCAGLSLLGYAGFTAIDPVYALPLDVVKKLGLPIRYSTK